MSAQEVNWIDEVISETLPTGLGGGVVSGDLRDLPSVSTLTGRSLDLLRNAAGQSQGRLDDWLFGPHRTMQASMPDAMLLVGMGLMRRQSGRLSGQANFYITDSGREVLAESEKAHGPAREARPVESYDTVGGILTVQFFDGEFVNIGPGTSPTDLVLEFSDRVDNDFVRGLASHLGGHVDTQSGGRATIIADQQPSYDEIGGYLRSLGGRIGSLTSQRPVMLARRPVQEIEKPPGPISVDEYIELVRMPPEAAGAFKHFLTYDPLSGSTNASTMMSYNEWEKLDLNTGDVWGAYDYPSLEARRVSRRQVRAAGQMTARQFHDQFVDPATLSYNDVLAWMTANEVNPNALQSEDYWYEIFKDFSPEKAPPDPDYAARRSVEESTYRERRARRLRASIPTLHDRVKWVLSSTTKPGLTADLVGAALEMSTAEAAEVLAALVQRGEVEEMAAGVFRVNYSPDESGSLCLPSASIP